MERPYILHLFTPGSQMSPFDVNMAADAGYRVASYVKLHTDEGLVGWSEFYDGFAGVPLAKMPYPPLPCTRLRLAVSVSAPPARVCAEIPLKVLRRKRLSRTETFTAAVWRQILRRCGR